MNTANIEVARAFKHLLPLNSLAFEGISDELLELYSQPAQQLVDYELVSGPLPMLAARLDYAERGWDSFPAKIVGKTKSSYKAAKHSNGAKWGKTRDHEQIRRDWQKWPDANVGIPTGVENGIFVVETDTPEGHNVDGEASLQALESKHGTLPTTLMAISPSGSKHHYFKHPGNGIKVISRGLPGYPGVDIKGDGGMVIAPPSVR